MVAPILEPTAQVEKREALLDAACEIIATVGFKAATVRDICNRAKANIAAVNYHFGDKEALYVEVLRHASARARAKHPAFKDNGNLSHEQLLRNFVKTYLQRLFDPSPDAWYAKLMSREMIEPSWALDTIVEESIRPEATLLNSIVGGLMGAGASEAEIRRCSLSVVSQCVFYYHCKPVLNRLFPDMKFDQHELDEIAAHITRFSLTAMQNYAASASR